jgi:hypothetical protein
MIASGIGVAAPGVPLGVMLYYMEDWLLLDWEYFQYFGTGNVYSSSKSN